MAGDPEVGLAMPPEDPNPTSALPVSSPGRRRALIVKFGAIGDVVMAIPAAAALLAEGFTIDWVASEAVAPLLQLYPWIHVVVVNEPRLLRGALGERLEAVLHLSQQLRRRVASHGAYHTVATLYYDRRYSLITSFLRAQRRVSLSRTDRAFALLDGRHHTDEYARVLTGRPDAETPVQLAPVPIPALPGPARPRQSGRLRVILVPAGARNVLRDDALRRWPLEHYVALAGDLLHRGYEVLLVGGPMDHWASPAFAAEAAAFPDTFADMVGSLSLVETLAMMQSADVRVTHDTGPLHLAGITQTAIVSIFGPTDPHGRLPRRWNTVALWGGEGFACRPCYDGRNYADCLHNGCMAQISPSQVVMEVEQLLEARASGLPLPPRVRLPEPSPFVQLVPEVLR